MTTYALDTNIISLILKNDRNIINEYRKANNEGHIFVIPIAVYYEVMRGLLAVDAKVQMQEFRNMCELFAIKEMTAEAWEKSAQIWATLRKSGNPLGKDDGDIFIASQCIVNDYVLITDNESDFKRIEGLNFINWKKY